MNDNHYGTNYPPPELPPVIDTAAKYIGNQGNQGGMPQNNPYLNMQSSQHSNMHSQYSGGGGTPSNHNIGFVDKKI